MQTIAGIRKSVGRERWRSFTIDLLSGTNNFILAEKYGIGLWDVRFSKMNQAKISLSLLDERKSNAIILPLTSRKVA
jgi:hypothetical protein